MAPTTKEAPKLTLPSGHPQAGYVSPDLSYTEDAGTLPDEEQEIHDERNEAREADLEAVLANEDKVARDEIKAREGQAETKPAPTPAPKSS